MRLLIRNLTTAIAVAVLATADSCILVAPFDPCQGTPNEIEDVGQMDKTWQLVSINGVRLPYRNFINVLETEFVTKLELDFDTDGYQGKCRGTTFTVGDVLAVVTLNTNGVTHFKHGAARFKRNHQQNTGIIVAPQGGVPFLRSSPFGSTMTINSTDLFYLPDAKKYFGPNLNLVFTRTRGPNQ